MRAQSAYIRKPNSDIIFDVVNTVILILILLIVAYPLYYVIIASISDPTMVAAGKTLLLPKGINAEGYRYIFESSTIWNGYLNTVIYTVSGTVLNVALTLLAAYALSRRELYGRGIITTYFIFTMYFGGGLIPTYLLINDIGIYNTRWALILPGAVSVYNMIIARTFFQSNIQDSILEAAAIDGCGMARTFFWIVLPVSQAIIAVLVIYYSVGHWNAFFDALIYLENSELFPLQVILRRILIENQILANDRATSPEAAERARKLAEMTKYCLIIVASLPVMIAYPFAQKYFIQGVMIGSVKG